MYQQRETCRICLSPELVKFLDLGSTPLADAFVTSPDQPEPRIPLELLICTNCWLVQLSADVDADKLFNADYGFFTSASPSSVTHFHNYVQSLIKDFNKECSGLVVEVASNDGVMLEHFQNAGCAVLGVDPALNAAIAAIKKKVLTLTAFFGKEVGIKIAEGFGQASLITANNVVAHVIDLHDFMDGVSALLADNGLFVFEVQYFPELFFNNQFDHVYHEHRSFFSLFPLHALLEQHGLTVFRVDAVNTQGGSIRVFARKGSVEVENSVGWYLKREEEMGLKQLDTYKGFQARVNFIRQKVWEVIEQAKAQGKKVVGYGASAKSNTLLNYFGLTNKEIEYIEDLTPHKIGRFTPGTHIPIYAPDKRAEKQPDFFLLLVWNYLNDILGREAAFLQGGGKFIIPIPSVTVYG